MARSPWKFPTLPTVLQQQLELAPVLGVLRSEQPLTREQRTLLIAFIEKHLQQPAAKADRTMWRDWRLAMLDVLAGNRNARRKNIANAFPDETKIGDVTVKNARKRFAAEVASYLDILAESGGKDALRAQGAEIIESLAWEFGADEEKLLALIHQNS